MHYTHDIQYNTASSGRNVKG